MTSPSTIQTDYTLQTARGSLIGLEFSDATTNNPLYRRFTRIRYALPPTRHRRWRKPEPLPPDWLFSDGNNHPRQYKTFGTICPQLVPEASFGTLFEPRLSENQMDEDCLFINIWVPAGGEGPAGGWPVQFQIQCNDFQSGDGLQQEFADPVDIYREHKDTPRIIVSANFRCGIFGYFASEELMPNRSKGDAFAGCGNFGLWDIRTAIEWTYSHIHLFGGNPHCLAVGGHGPMTALQLHFDAFSTTGHPIIRRAFLFSGAIGIQPPSVQSDKVRARFDEICSRMNIDEDLPTKDRMKLLRGGSPQKLLEIVRTMETEFEPVTDGYGGFIPASMMDTIWSGELGRKLKDRGAQVLIGDPSNEEAYYSFCIRRISKAIVDRASLIKRLSAWYPEDIVESLVQRYELPFDNDWARLHSQILADVQCHATARGFARCLFKGGMTAQHVLRYHIKWRPKGLEDCIVSETGISHVLDMPVWWYSGWRSGFSRRDKQDVLNFARPFARFLRGDISALCGWGTEAEAEVRMLAPDGSVLVCDDPMYARMKDTWDAIRDTQLRGRSSSMLRPKIT